MASLRELLTEEGFHHKKTAQNPKFKPLMRQKKKFSQEKQLQEIKPLPLYICNDDGKNIESSKHNDEKGIIRNGSWSFHSKSKRLVGLASESSNYSKSLVSQSSRTVGPPLDEVAIRAVIAILSGYIGRYLKDDLFRKRIRDKCSSYLVRRRRNHSESDYYGDDIDDDEVLVNMKLGMENIDKLVQDQGNQEQMKIKSLRNSIELLTIVASLNSKTARDSSTCGIPNSHLSACAQLYLAIVYKLQKNHRICARHLLQVFCDSPFLGRTYLLPDLWEHLFLPHLLHLKIWYTEEIENLIVSNDCHSEREKKMKSLSRVYGYKLDSGTALFALYYKQWLKIGADEPPLPVITLPPRPSHRSSRKKSSDSFISQSSINLNLYKEVFGPKLELKPTALHEQNGVLSIGWGSGSEIDELCGDAYKFSSFKKEKTTYHGRSLRRIDNNCAELRSESLRLDYYQFFSCRNVKVESLVNKYRSNNASFREQTTVLSSEFVGAITTICSSNILSECEFAIRVITKAWLKSHGDPLIEEALRQSRVVEGILEVLFASSEDEILELAISVLAELVARNDAIRQIIMSSDPQLEIFVRLLGSTSLFLKAAVLLYLAKPHAYQMSSQEWVPLVIRLLEFGDKALTLFTVQCNPQVAAIHLLEQLLTGFEEDKNLENARQVVSLGGLNMIMRRIEEGDFNGRNKAALIIYCCIRAEGSCRSFLADNINKSSLLELIVLGSSKNSGGCAALSVLAELLYLDRITKILNFLRGLKDGWGGLDTMHILFIFLRRAPPDKRPLVAMILLLIDIVEDHSKSSFYRSEAIEAFVATLDCQKCNKTMQEQSARALHLLAGNFSYNGESIMEKSILQKAGFREHFLSEDSPYGKEIVVYDLSDKNNEEDEAENWRKIAAIALLKSENKNMLLALANCMTNGTPCLARASLVTISWMSSYLHLVEGKNLPQMAFSIFTPQLIKSLSYSKDAETRVLASYSLLCLVKNSGCGSVLQLLDKDSLGNLQNLSLVTWTASELISIFSKGSLRQK